MKKILTLALLLFNFSNLFAQIGEVKIYNPEADAKADIEKAVQLAKTVNKHVLLLIGGNWCPWCIRLHEFIAADSQIDSLINADYLVVKVNVAKEREKRNMDLFGKLGNPQRFGFPVLVVLNREGERIHTQDSWFLEQDKSYNRDKLIHFLRMWNVVTDPSQGVNDDPPYEWPSDPAVSEKLHRWQDWKFGVLIHWGPYSEWGVVESWSLCPEDEGWCVRRGPFADDYDTYTREYEKIRETFNPMKFHPEKWAAACGNAGMKYVVFTTKHHDGFCMFNTRYTDYKITDPKSVFSPNNKSNIVDEVFQAFRSQGMGIGAYFSKPDWHSDDYWWPYFPVFDRNVNYNPVKYPERWKRFREFTFNQLEELMTDYGKVDILWLDGGWVRPEGTLTEETRPWLGKNQWIQDINMPVIATMARKHQPGLLIVDRSVHGEFENYRTPEHQVPDKVLDYPWESCIPLGDSWYSTGPGEHYKSVNWVIQTLVKIVSRGGNFLLGIGPDKTGEMAPEVYEKLKEVGEWMKVNSSAIYGTKPLEPYQVDHFFFTQSNDEKTRYAILLRDEDEDMPLQVSLPDVFIGDNKTVGLLGYAKELNVMSSVNGSLVKIPESFRKNRSGTPAVVFAVKVIP